jgi:hypothetical protein
MLRIEYDGSSKVIRRLCQLVNDLFDHSEKCDSRCTMTEDNIDLLLHTFFEDDAFAYLVDSAGHVILDSTGHPIYTVYLRRKE